MAAHAEADLVNALMASDLTVKDLWLRYLALGGCRSRQELQDFLSGESGWTKSDSALLRHALVEHGELGSEGGTDGEREIQP